MKKVALINPPQKYLKKSFKFSLYVPVGLLSIASRIKDICRLDFFDFLAEDFSKTRIENYYIYGSKFERIKERIKESFPDIVGISIPFSTQLAAALKIRDICREVNPGVKVVLGGPEPSIRYEYLIKNELCDFCVVGEGENTFYELIECLDRGQSPKGIKGLAYKSGGKLSYERRDYINRLDKLPLPAYELIDLRKYWGNPWFYNMRSRLKKNSLPIFTSRGCPYNCIFCSIHLHMGSRYRPNSPLYVIDHLKYCLENFGIKRFHFEDDNISLDKPRFEAILDGIINQGLPIEWDVPNGIRADTLDFDLLSKMKDSGCRALAIGAESGNQRVLNNIIKKDSSLDKIIEAAENCKRLGIRLLAFYIIGFPGESRKDIQDTIDFSLKMLRLYDTNPALLLATPLYGTELYNICLEKGFLSKDVDEDSLASATQPYGIPMIETGEFDRPYLKRVIKYYNLRLAGELIRYHLREYKRKCKKILDFNKTA